MHKDGKNLLLVDQWGDEKGAEYIEHIELAYDKECDRLLVHRVPTEGGKQVLSFLGGSGLSARTYILGKMLHGGLSALFVGALVRVIPLHAPVAAVLADQVERIAGLDFHTALVISTVSAWVVFLFFLLLAVAAVRKSGGKGRSRMV